MNADRAFKVALFHLQEAFRLDDQGDDDGHLAWSHVEKAREALAVGVVSAALPDDQLRDKVAEALQRHCERHGTTRLMDDEAAALADVAIRAGVSATPAPPEQDGSAPERLALYPHAAGREWSSKQYDDWKADLAVEYVRADLAVLPADRPMIDRQANVGHVFEAATPAPPEDTKQVSMDHSAPAPPEQETLTPEEARGVITAMEFGTPWPVPALLQKARAKLAVLAAVGPKGDTDA